jgi:hypothetical protein
MTHAEYGGCQDCPDHKEDWDRVTKCAYGRYKNRPRKVPIADIVLTPPWCPKIRKYQEPD